VPRNSLSRALLAIGLVVLLQALFALIGCGGNGKVASSVNPPAASPRDQSTTTTPTVPDGDATATARYLKSCLASDDLDTAAGAGSAPNDRLPVEVIATRGTGGPGALLAVYDTARQAAIALPDIQDRLGQQASQGVRATAEQHGSVSILWIPSPPNAALRTEVSACLEGLQRSG
jgi:hypothetical protein